MLRNLYNQVSTNSPGDVLFRPFIWFDLNMGVTQSLNTAWRFECNKYYVIIN